MRIAADDARRKLCIMEWLDRASRWYRSHFGIDADSELDPKEVLKQILTAMEDSKVEGLDGHFYVANKYILELAVATEEERAYVLSVIDEQELSASVEQVKNAKGWSTRGPLDFTFEEIETFPGGRKLYVRALFDKNVSQKTKLLSETEPSASADMLSKSRRMSAPRPRGQHC